MVHPAFQLALLGALLAGGVSAQDISGDWQGTLKAGPQDLRTVVRISKGETEPWKAKLYAIDQSPSPIQVDSVSFDGSTLKFKIEMISGSYEGQISQGANTFTGTWTQGGPLPLELKRVTKETAWAIDSCSHSVRFVTVDRNVRLEVLDWGGTGRALVLLAGLGNDAHVFDKFSSKLISNYHVYGITRRGFGESSVPKEGYEADRLGDDVLEVIAALKLDRPVLAGHSIAGEELSSIGSRHPQKVSGLIYLDAGYPYAFYDRSTASIHNLSVAVPELKNELDKLHQGRGYNPAVIQELLHTILPTFEKNLKEALKDLNATKALLGAQASEMRLPIPEAILTGTRIFTEINAPVFAIFAIPHSMSGFHMSAKERAASEARDAIVTGAQAKAFEAGIPGAKVIRLSRADHYVFESNEEDVLREMNAWIATLK